MNLKTSSMVRPTMRKGSNISQTRGNKKRRMRATGQQITRRIHQRITERKSFMSDIYAIHANQPPDSKDGDIKTVRLWRPDKFFTSVHCGGRKCTPRGLFKDIGNQV
jgi:hypothetical protein